MLSDKPSRNLKRLFSMSLKSKGLTQKTMVLSDETIAAVEREYQMPGGQKFQWSTYLAHLVASDLKRLNEKHVEAPAEEVAR